MFETKKMFLVAVLLFSSALLLAGCTASGDQNSSPNEQPSIQIQGYGGGQGFQNLTREQRQQLFQQRMQLAVAACQGKNEGDPCVVQSQRGTANGTCKTLNGTFACSFGMRGSFNGTRGNYTRGQGQ